MPNFMNAAQIKIEPVVPTDEDGRWVQPDEPTEIWTDYAIVNRYQKDGHRYMLGVTSPVGYKGASAAFVQLALPTVLWVSDWTAARYGKCPDVPDTEVNPGEWILLDQFVEPHSLDLDGGGTVPLYRISGTYVYGCVNPSGNLFDDVNFPRPPWMDDDFERDVPEDVYDDNIIEQGNNPGVGPGGNLNPGV